MKKVLPQKHSAKICAVCGIKKPVSAFEQLSSGHLKEYSRICYNCRFKSNRDGRDKLIISPEEDDEEGGGKGRSLSIDYDTKRHAAKMQEQFLEEREQEKIDLDKEKQETKEDSSKEEKESDKKEMEHYDFHTGFKDTEASKEQKPLSSRAQWAGWLADHQIKTSETQPSHPTDKTSTIEIETATKKTGLFEQPTEKESPQNLSQDKTAAIVESQQLHIEYLERSGAPRLDQARAMHQHLTGSISSVNEYNIFFRKYTPSQTPTSLKNGALSTTDLSKKSDELSKEKTAEEPLSDLLKKSLK